MQIHAPNVTMATTSPPILPVSSSENLTADPPHPPITTPVVRAFLNHLTSTIRSALSDRRPWPELIDRTSFSKPESISNTTTRIRKNYAYFRINYLTIIATIITISLLTNPVSLITLLGLLSAWIFLYLLRPSVSPLVVFGRTFSNRETLGLLVILSVIVIFLTNVGTILITATLIGTGVVCVHGAFRVPEDLFLDEQEPVGGGSQARLKPNSNEAFALGLQVLKAP